jgi:hypothetical protein
MQTKLPAEKLAAGGLRLNTKYRRVSDLHILCPLTSSIRTGGRAKLIFESTNNRYKFLTGPIFLAVKQTKIHCKLFFNKFGTITFISPNRKLSTAV